MSVTKFLLPAIGSALLVAAAPSQAATTVLTFDDISEGTVATNQYTGLTISGGSVLTQNSGLNSIYPPFSTPNVLYNYSSNTIGIDFTSPVDSVGGYITGSTSVILSVFSGGTLLGTIATSGANYTGSGGTPNAFLNLAFSNITSATFRAATGGGNSFTLDNLTVGGTIINNTGAVPEPATWALMILGFGAIGASMRRRRPMATLLQAA